MTASKTRACPACGETNYIGNLLCGRCDAPIHALGAPERAPLSDFQCPDCGADGGNSFEALHKAHPQNANFAPPPEPQISLLEFMIAGAASVFAPDALTALANVRFGIGARIILTIVLFAAYIAARRLWIFNKRPLWQSALAEWRRSRLCPQCGGEWRARAARQKF